MTGALDRPLIAPERCSLSPSGLARQRDRAVALRAAVRNVVRTSDELEVSFDATVDRPLLSELVETERRCCSFLVIDLDERARRLRIAAEDSAGRRLLGEFAALFADGAVR